MWSKYCDTVVQELSRPQQVGWVVAYTDGSAQRGRGRMQEGVWVDGLPDRDPVAHVPVAERQGVCCGELRGVLWALTSRWWGRT